MYGIFTNVLWYIEFVFMAILMTTFFVSMLYIAKSNYVAYNIQFDLRRKNPKEQRERKLNKQNATVRVKQPQRPVCYDVECIWFCRVIASIVTIAVCYWGAYTFISDTKLKFGLFVP